MGTFSIIAEVAEHHIRDAMERGEFDNLPGKGKPLPPDDTPLISEDLRMAYKILKNSGHLPPEIADCKEINTAIELLESCTDEQQRYRQIQKINYLTMKLNTRRRTPFHLETDSPYYDKVVDKVPVKGK